jgi:hypothetical protein
MTYEQLTASRKKTISDFPLRFAFSDSQFKEVVAELGPADTLVSIGGGGILRKTDQVAFDKLWDDAQAEMSEAMKDDSFMMSAMVYELGNHEYVYTYDDSDTVECLDLDVNDERTARILAIAKKTVLSNDE